MAFILGFIGIKLILEALQSNKLPFINGGEPVPGVPEMPIWLSLAVIFGTIASPRWRAWPDAAGPRRAVADNRALD